MAPTISSPIAAASDTSIMSTERCTMGLSPRSAKASEPRRFYFLAAAGYRLRSLRVPPESTSERAASAISSWDLGMVMEAHSRCRSWSARALHPSSSSSMPIHSFWNRTVYRRQPRTRSRAAQDTCGASCRRWHFNESTASFVAPCRYAPKANHRSSDLRPMVSGIGLGPIPRNARFLSTRRLRSVFRKIRSSA